MPQTYRAAQQGGAVVCGTVYAGASRIDVGCTSLLVVALVQVRHASRGAVGACNCLASFDAGASRIDVGCTLLLVVALVQARHASRESVGRIC